MQHQLGRMLRFSLVCFAAAQLVSQPLLANETVAAQQTQLKKLDMLNGKWQGTAWRILPNGEKYSFTQTEKVGPKLEGAIKTIEGQGFNDAGESVFHAFAIVSFDPQTEKLMMRSYAEGRIGDFELQVDDNGFAWQIPAGPAKIKYVATIKDGTWSEYGERVVPGRPPFRFFEMKLTRQE